MYCKACGSIVSEKAANFCAACGAKLSTAERTTESSIWKLSVRRKFGVTVVALLLAVAWYFFVIGAMHPSPSSPHSSQVSGFALWSGILAAILAHKRRWMWFFLGMIISIPMMFLAQVVGSMLR